MPVAAPGPKPPCITTVAYAPPVQFSPGRLPDIKACSCQDRARCCSPLFLPRQPDLISGRCIPAAAKQHPRHFPTFVRHTTTSCNHHKPFLFDISKVKHLLLTLTVLSHVASIYYVKMTGLSSSPKPAQAASHSLLAEPSLPSNTKDSPCADATENDSDLAMQ